MIVLVCVLCSALTVCIALFAWFLDAFNKLDRTNDRLMFENNQLREENEKLRRGVWYS